MSYDTCLSNSDLCHLVWFSLGLSRFLHLALFHSFTWLIHTPLPTCTTSLSIHVSMDIWAASRSWLLYMVLQCTFGCMFFFPFWILVYVLLGARLLDHMISLFLPCKDIAILCSILAFTISIPPAPSEGSLYPCLLHHLYFVDLLMMAIQTGAKWHLILVLICVSLVIQNIEHLFMCFLFLLNSLSSIY